MLEVDKFSQDIWHIFDFVMLFAFGFNFDIFFQPYTNIATTCIHLDLIYCSAAEFRLWHWMAPEFRKRRCISRIITWLRCFFPGFDRFIPGFDRFIPGFDRFIPASIPVTGTLPPTIKNISSKKMYFLNLISSFFISLIWNNTIKKYSAMPRMHIFLKNTVNTNPKLFRA